MLEKMDAFFEARLAGYDEHMLTAIEGAEAFYPFTAGQLPSAPQSRVLDLGCGTGLELAWYFARNPSAQITGVDLSAGMLKRLQEKFPDKALRLVCGSYFDVPFGENQYDAAVSVESLHHFTKEEKTPLYRRVQAALKPGGFFILTDYFAPCEADEIQYRQDLLRLKEAQGIDDGEYYHYDTPLTVQHETEALLAAGFCRVETLARWQNTWTLKAVR